MKRRHSAVEPRPRTDGFSPPGPRSWQPFLLAGLAGLLTATPLLPSETVQLGSGSLALIACWLLLLLGWAGMGLRGGGISWRPGIELVLLLLLLGWAVLSAAVMAGEGQPRATWNAVWQWVSLALTFFLTQQLAEQPAHRRGLLALMMGLAVGLSVVGYAQYFVEQPAALARYRADPEGTLREAGIVAPPDSPTRDAFENRIESVEPFATFALANSLAGFLSAWLTVALGVGILHGRDAPGRRVPLAAALTVLAILGCWILTKSRTAYVATFAGAFLLVVYGRRSGWRPGWRVTAAALGICLALPVAAYLAGGLDVLVLLQASQALLYRVQYWRATLRLIADYPLFGCGPGNFQQYYVAYKLPEASESVADPHNFLLEIWASAGTPAAILLLALLACLVWRAVTSGRGVPPVASAALPASPSPGGGAWIYAGGAAGVCFGWMLCTLLEGFQPSSSLLVAGFPAGCAAVALWHPWVARGQLSRTVPGAAAAVLLINLLGAGGIGFASVAQSLWVLLAIVAAEAGQGGGRPLPRRCAAGILTAGVLGLAVFAWSSYFPQMESRRLLLESDYLLSQGRAREALDSARRAAEADPLSEAGWQRVASSCFDAWLATGDGLLQAEFVAANAKMVAINPRSSGVRQQTGDWWLAAYRRFNDPAYMGRAVEAYAAAVRLYPNHGFGHGQLAWARHLAGDVPGAAGAAAEALRLDALNPHQEQKLERRRLFDPGRTDPQQSPSPGNRTAEQVLRELRNKPSDSR